MANVTITWTNPDDGSGSLNSNIDEIHVFRLNGDQSAVYPLSNGIVSAEQATAFVNAYSGENSGSISPINSSDSSTLNYTALGQATYSDDSVPAGTYTYGVFSKNLAGYGPGDVAVVTV